MDIIGSPGPPQFQEVRRRYEILRQHLIQTGEFPILHRPAVIIGMPGKGPEGDVGYNVNKGYEIYICYNGSVNQIMHVLLHELCHNLVKEYDHSADFWTDFGKLEDIAVNLGIYKHITTQSFCGGTISD
jgi:WLM domain